MKTNCLGQGRSHCRNFTAIMHICVTPRDYKTLFDKSWRQLHRLIKRQRHKDHDEKNFVPLHCYEEVCLQSKPRYKINTPLLVVLPIAVVPIIVIIIFPIIVLLFKSTSGSFVIFFNGSLVSADARIEKSSCAITEPGCRMNGKHDVGLRRIGTTHSRR